MLLWMDGFDHYGDDEDLLTQGVYAEAGLVTLSSTNPRTGTRCARLGFNVGVHGLRRIFGADLNEAGVGYAFYIPTLPSDSSSLVLMRWSDNANDPQCTLMLTSTGQLELRRGSKSGTIIATSAPVVVARSYQHLEVRFKCDQSTGACEARVNGVTVLSVTGVDTADLATTIIAQVKFGNEAGLNTGSPAYMDVDDLFAWDTNGAFNTDFVGDKKVYTNFPNGDGADEDWTPSIGSNSYAMLDNVPPLDGSEYLSADNPGLTSSFAISNLPPEVVAIAGIMTATRAQKTDAGNAKIRVSIESVAANDAGAEHALSQAWTYYHDVFEVDPNTDAPWAVAAFNAAGAILDRTE